jgi:hypothetical protein
VRRREGRVHYGGAAAHGQDRRAAAAASAGVVDANNPPLSPELPSGDQPHFLPGTLCFVLAACDDGVLEPRPTDAPPSGPAFAGAPDMETAQFSWTYSSDCGVFDDVQAGSAQLKFWAFYDQAGTPTSERVHYVFKVTHTNSVTGNVLRDDGGMATSICSPDR